MRRPLALLTPAERDIRRAASREYYLRNQERKIAYARARRAAYPMSAERNSARNAAYRARYPERARESTERWRARNQERYRAASLTRTKAWQAAHPVEHRAYTVQYRLAHPKASREWLARHPGKNALYQRRHRARKLAATVELFTVADWTALCEMYGQRCAYCLRRVKLTQDHIQPLSRGGAHTLENIVPACHACNVRKNAQPLLAWLLRGA